MGRRRVFDDHRLDNTEKTRRFHDKTAAIDIELDAAF